MAEAAVEEDTTTEVTVEVKTIDLKWDLRRDAIKQVWEGPDIECWLTTPLPGSHPFLWAGLIRQSHLL